MTHESGDMNVRAGLLVGLVTILLIGSTGISTTGSAASAGGTQAESFAVDQDEIDADEVRMDVALEPDGSAAWTLEFWVRLDDEESRTAFDSLQDEIEDDPDERVDAFAGGIHETVDGASEMTGREMTADAFDVSTDRHSFGREYGVVSYTFQWDGFAAVEDGELHAGDAIEGLFLEDGTRLLFEWPEEYELASADPAPDDEREHAVIWRGNDTEFVSGEPRLVVTAGGTGLGTTILASVAIGVIVAGIAGAWWFRSRAGGTAGSPDQNGPANTPDTESALHAENDDTAALTGTTTAGADGLVEQELMSNEEQVLQLLEAHGGRMKQQAVVEQLGWTDAKTSKVVTGLRDEGKLESFRLGRENVLTVPDDTGDGGDESL